MNESIFPFVDTTVADDEEQEEELERFCEYAYDFENNCLLLDKDNRHYYVYENEALLIWIFKVLRTSRYRYLAYSYDYGTEMFDLIGQTADKEVIVLEVKRYITEAIMFNDYIKAIQDFEIEFDESIFKIAFSIETIYGTTQFTDEWRNTTWV